MKIDAERVVDGLLDGITEALKQGDWVNISGFGTFTAQCVTHAPDAWPADLLFDPNLNDYGSPRGLAATLDLSEVIVAVERY